MGINDFSSVNGLPKDVIKSLAFWTHPLADALMQDSRGFNRPMMVAMGGPPHSGKSVFAAHLRDRLDEAGYPTVHLRVSDFRLSKHARERMAESVHPLFAYSGQIGSHDTRELERVLLALRAGDVRQPIHIPVYDKQNDVRAAFSQWKVVRETPRIVLVSGWTLGAIAEESHQLTTPVNELERTRDPDGTWRRTVNQIIRDDYQPFYGLFDRWTYGKPPSYAAVCDWIVQDHTLWMEQMAERNADLTDIQKQSAELLCALCERPCLASIERLAAKSDYLLTLGEQRRITSFTRQRND